MESTHDNLEKISIDEAYDSEPWCYDARGLLILTFAYRSTLPVQIKFFAQNATSKTGRVGFFILT